MAETKGPLYMGFDLSTQQLKGIVIQSDLKLVHEAKVDFDADFGSKYGINKGVLTNPSENEVFAPVALWLDAVNLVLDRLRDAGLDFARVKGLSGAGMQHGTVFWSKQATGLLANLDPEKPLTEQLHPDVRSGQGGDRHAGSGAFAHPMSPNWQDASTQTQCDAFDGRLGDPETLARITGSKAHHRFSGPQIMRYREKYPDHYASTSRISLVSSFLASIFLGDVAPIDISDVGGTNLWDTHRGAWHEDLLSLAAGGSPAAAADLRAKLGAVPEDGGATFGTVSPYFIGRYGFPSDCRIIAFTGDNPATILSLPLRASDAMVSLGTSTTFLMSTSEYKPDPAYHFMNHPTTAGLYMFMLCYKNGGLAREAIRDQLNARAFPLAVLRSWKTFDATALGTAPLAQADPDAPMRLGLYFPRPEIVPHLPAGQWRYTYDARAGELAPGPATFEPRDARTIVESQMLSLRLRSQALVGGGNGGGGDNDHTTTGSPPPQPRRVYLVGGGSANPAIASICGEVLGGTDGVFRLEIGGNACALGAAYKAVWGCERRSRAPEGGQGQGQGHETFEELIGARWQAERFVQKVADGYQQGVYEQYGEAVVGFERMEKAVLELQQRQQQQEEEASGTRG
ncbi:putative D-Xylulose kinase [Dissoconium aciculare CBS 342.82]|uniref:Xylulose kinase n=1 Tax=Dissoconium aciculare CBS 342.82 TaxID=1314786 RepID=A0A6J3MA24_9PEZI|nr:putative D-Xylulose kinase [Dissoconium aciculare CBS 342.82]KAF1823662.1 putative D-Xylulose kinase [Dissoconium aciculare CBS 342.82]